MLNLLGRSQIQSSHQGLLTLRLGSEETLEDETFELMDSSSTFDFIFDTTHVEAQQIGAMSAEQQGKLSEHLATMLDKGLLAPEKVLEILNSLKSMSVDGANVVMIRGDSIHMVNLIKKCNLMIKKRQLL